MGMKNKEGYPDPTAGQAIKNASKVPKYIKDIFRALNMVASMHSLEITEMRDKKTGRLYDMRGGYRVHGRTGTKTDSHKQPDNGSITGRV